MFDLTENPFYLLGVPLDASVEDIVNCTQDAVLEGRTDDASATRAQQTLIRPRPRLEAELSWFADVAPEVADKLARIVLDCELEAAVAASKGAAPLTRANAAAQLCGRFPQSAEPVRLLIDAWGELDRAEIFEAILRARLRAGVPRPDPDHFEEALEALENAHARQAARSIGSMRAPGSTLAEMVEAAIRRQALTAMLRRIVREYDKASEPRLAALREQIEAEIKGCRADPGIAPAAVDRLRELLAAWDAINQPVQLLEQADGHEEERSRELCFNLRNLVLFLANVHGRYREALDLTHALLYTFQELESTAARLREDLRVLEDIVRRLPPEQVLLRPSTHSRAKA